jgi:hypothetical protein
LEQTKQGERQWIASGMMEGVNSSMIYLIYCKKFCKCCNVPQSQQLKKKQMMLLEVVFMSQAIFFRKCNLNYLVIYYIKRTFNLFVIEFYVRQI